MASMCTVLHGTWPDVIIALPGCSAKAELPREQSMSSQRSSIGWADWNEARVVTKDSGTVNNDPDASPSPPFVDPERLSPSQMPVVVRAALRLRHMAKVRLSCV